MFRTSNKVTRPEKALILGFMAGSRGKFCIYLVYQYLSGESKKPTLAHNFAKCLLIFRILLPANSAVIV